MERGVRVLNLMSPKRPRPSRETAETRPSEEQEMPVHEEGQESGSERLRMVQLEMTLPWGSTLIPFLNSRRETESDSESDPEQVARRRGRRRVRMCERLI